MIKRSKNNFFLSLPQQNSEAVFFNFNTKISKQWKYSQVN